MKNANLGQEVIKLSKEKWGWMSKRNVDALDALFYEKAVFTNPFMVTEVYVQQDAHWKLISLSFTRYLPPSNTNNYRNLGD